MGHLTRIANCIVHSTDKGPNSTLVQQLIKGNVNTLKLLVVSSMIKFLGNYTTLKMKSSFWIEKEYFDIFCLKSVVLKHVCIF